MKLITAIKRFLTPARVVDAYYNSKTNVLTLVYLKKGIVKYHGYGTHWYKLPEFVLVDNIDKRFFLLRYHDLCKFNDLCK